MCPLGVVELESPGQGFEHPGRCASQCPPLQLCVVLDTHPGQCGHLTATQTGHSANTAGGQASLLGCDLGSARLQELTDLLTVVHT